MIRLGHEPGAEGRGEPAVILAIAGVLFFAEGVALSYDMVVLSINSVPGSEAAALAILTGLVLLVLAAVGRAYPAIRFHIGTFVVVLGAVGIWWGGGFLAGTILALLGGLLLLILPPW